jgi:basic membrane lipoprotein Med (substrate-binding protein (PBP1-ABC) superfamily)
MKTTNRYWIAVTAVLLLALVLGACAPTPAPAGQATAPAGGEQPTAVGQVPAQRFRIAVVLPGRPNDYGISHGVYDALVEYQTLHGSDVVELAVSENNFVVENAASAIRDYASQGFDVVVAPSSAFGSALQEIAPDFPNVSFVWGTTPDTFGMPNVYAFIVEARQSGFALGVLGASMFDRIGMVLPLDVGSIAGTRAGFEAGVRATKPNAEVLVTFTGAFGDITLANQAARTMADAGVELIVSQTEIATGAATVARERNIPFMGVNEDFTPFAPEVTIASADFHYGAVLGPMFDQIRAGTLGGEMMALSFANGGLEIVFNEQYPPVAEARQAAEQAIQQLISGAITIP